MSAMYAPGHPGPFGPPLLRALRRQLPVAVLVVVVALGIDALWSGDGAPPASDERGLAHAHVEREIVEMYPIEGRWVVARATGYSYEYAMKEVRGSGRFAAEASLREAVADLERKAAMRKTPDPVGLGLPAGCLAVSAPKARELSEASGGVRRSILETWPDERFAGLLTISSVGFSRDGRTAIVYLDRTWGRLAGGGGLALFRFEEGEWRHVESFGDWMS